MKLRRRRKNVSMTDSIYSALKGNQAYVDQMQIILFLYVTFTYKTITSERLLRSTRLITNDSYLKIDWVIHLS